MLRCNNCGKEIRKPNHSLDVGWIHTNGRIRCDGIWRNKGGFKKAKKASYFKFEDYLKSIEDALL